MNVHQTATSNSLKELAAQGQSVWLDYIRRRMLGDGELQRLMEQDGLRGMTSNPAIFEKAIAGSDDYDASIKQLLAESDRDAGTLFEQLAVDDIRKAAELLDPVYQATRGRDGYVSIEVSPYLAYDTEQTINEARRLWRTVGKPNIMVKVPGTPQGIPAIRQLVSEGLNINITLLFAQEVYSQVAEAYMSGLEARASENLDISKIAGVASFFVSRIDTMVDQIISRKLEAETNDQKRQELKALPGKVAIANAKLAYRIYNQIIAGFRWKALESKGAQPQRLLWASTGTKNPAYSDTLYVDELIGPDTVNTLPPATLDAFRDHGKPSRTLDRELEQAKDVIERLPSLGISLAEITNKLVEDGVVIFADAADKLLAAVERKRENLLGEKLNKFAYQLQPELEASVKASVEDWRSHWKVRRLWDADASLWTGHDEAHWLGWLNVCANQLNDPQYLAAANALNGRFKHAVLLGMGGSSLGPEVLSRSFGPIAGFPRLVILDSTDPDQIMTVERAIELSSTLFIVSSKSGSTLEPNALMQYFYARAAQRLGAKAAGKHFIAITDPGSSLEKAATSLGFLHVHYGAPSIGGRYSVLSNFGMIPAALAGIDAEKFLRSAQIMVNSCMQSVPPSDNRGILLGLILGTLWQKGKDKVTIISSPKISAFGSWLEQLVAESTGKNGKGLIPVDGEPLGPPEVYGNDRVFVYVRYQPAADAAQDSAVGALAAAGHPVIRVFVSDVYTLGQEFFAWEIAIAAAGSIMGINPFNQPDVEASKQASRMLAAQFEKTGKLRIDAPIFSRDGIEVYASAKTASAPQCLDLGAVLNSHFKQIRTGDYVALLAYMERNDAHGKLLQDIRTQLRDSKKIATCVGFGPRFLHSTGQAYKGGPNTGVFLQITCDDSRDISVPKEKCTFGVIKTAQAQGDFQVLAQRERRVLRVHLKDADKGLEQLKLAVREALGK